MAGFAPSYYRPGDLNQVLGDIINNPSCRTAGQDYDDDTVDAPDSDDWDAVAEAEMQRQHQSEYRDAMRVSLQHIATPAPTAAYATHRNHRGSSQSTQAPSHIQVPQRQSSSRQHRRSRSRASLTSASASSPTWRQSLSPPLVQRPPRTHHREVSIHRMASPPPTSPQPRFSSAGSDATLFDLNAVMQFQRADSALANRSLKRQMSTLSSTSAFSGFHAHPAVRPLELQESREKLGEAAGPDETADDVVYPGPLALTLIIIGVCLSVFVISLDRNIIATAIPHITDQFHSYADIGWYGSAYLLTASTFQPLYGRIYMTFDTKFSFLVALTNFAIGSLLCGVSPNSTALIVGRAIQGLGAAGILTGAFVVVTHAVPLQKRPVFFAAVGILYGVGALCGPLLGGVFADLVLWRWCFYINLPTTGVTFASVFLFFKSNKKSQPKVLADGRAKTRPSFLKRVLVLDLIGNLILLVTCVMLFLALQYSEQQYSWSSARVVGLLVGFIVGGLIFVGWMFYKGDDALIPPRIARQRTVAASCLAAFFIYAVVLMQSYYLPIWFQAIKDDSAVRSGVNMIPYMLANAVFSLIAGVVVSKNGYFAPPAILGCAIGTVGSGLLSTLNVNTSSSAWIGFEILTSAGLGLAIQQGFTAVQTALPLEEVPIGTAAVVASQSLGGSVFVSVGNTLLQNHLLSAQDANKIPGVDIRVVIEQGATMFRSHVPESALPALLELYNASLQRVFIAAIPLCGCAFLASLLMEFNSVKKAKPKEDKRFEDASEGGKAC